MPPGHTAQPVIDFVSTTAIDHATVKPLFAKSGKIVKPELILPYFRSIADFD
jgi:hypothetical protein